GGHAQLQTHLFCSEQPFCAQAAVATFQLKGSSDMSNLLQIEWFVLPSSDAFPIEDFCHLAVAVVVQQAIDPSNIFRFRLPNLSDWQRFDQRETSRCTTTETDMGLDRLAVE